MRSITPVTQCIALFVAAIVVFGTLAVCPAFAEEEKGAYEETFESPNYYYDFDDILIPRELDPVDDEKYVFDDPRFLAGFRIFSGRVVAEDVFNFFVNNMLRDGWVKKFSLKSDKSVLVFEKATKSCTVQIEDGFSTKVTVFAIEFKDVLQQ